MSERKKVVVTGASGLIAGQMLPALRKHYDLTLLDVRTTDRNGHEVPGTQVTDLLDATEAKIKQHNIKSIEDVRKFPGKIVTFSASMQKERESLRDFLFKNLYRHYRVLRMSNKARRFIKELFKVYISQPEQLPTSPRARIKTEGSYRVVCDYIAGMTDRYALNEYKKLFQPFERV